MNVDLILMSDDDILEFKKNIQYAFQNENVLAYAKSSGKEIIFNSDMEQLKC